MLDKYNFTVSVWNVGELIIVRVGTEGDDPSIRRSVYDYSNLPDVIALTVQEYLNTLNDQ